VVIGKASRFFLTHLEARLPVLLGLINQGIML